MTLSDYKTLAEIVALILGGAWAVYGFFVLRQREKATREIRNIDLDAQRIEQEIRQVAVIRTEIEVSTRALCANDGHLLLVEVTLVNEGKRDTRLKWKGEPAAFAIRRVVFNGDGIATFPNEPIQLTVRQTRDPKAEAVSHVVRAGASERLAFAARLSYSGVYLLSFRASVAPDEVGVSVKAGTTPNSPVAWTATKYVFVEDGQPCTPHGRCAMETGSAGDSYAGKRQGISSKSRTYF